MASTGKIDHGGITALFVLSIVMTLLATFVVVLRIYSKRSRGKQLDQNDWLIEAALWGIMICAIVSLSSGGVGIPLEALEAVGDWLLIRALKCLFAVEILYASALSVVKLSLLDMYRRIFPTRFMNIGTWIIQLIVFMYWLANMLLVFLQCDPLSRFWDISAGGSCLPALSCFIVAAVPNVAIDVMIMALPVFEIGRLQMGFWKKVAVCVVFFTGGCVIIIGGLRLSSGVELLRTLDANFSMKLAPLWVWTVVEPSIAIICACMPTLGPLLRANFGSSAARMKRRWKAWRQPQGSRDNFKTIDTIGGGSLRPANRARPASTSKDLDSTGSTGRFSRLADSDGPPFHEQQGQSQANLCPEGYGVQRLVTVAWKRASSSGSVEIPMTDIAVRQETTWSESRAQAEAQAEAEAEADEEAKRASAVSTRRASAISTRRP